MNIPEVVTSKSRSDGAKRMWIRRKAKMSNAAVQQVPIKSWIAHGEWFTLMGTLIGCFIFCFHEVKHTNDRLDDHMEAINRRVDEANKRSDELHKEFYELLKEMRDK